MTTTETGGGPSPTPSPPGWLAQQHQKLDEWEARVGLPACRVPLFQDVAVKFLELPPGDRKKLTPDECADACVVLSQYAAHLHRVAQREEADVVLLKERVRKLAAERAQQQDAFKFEDKMLLAVRESPEASSLDLQRVAAEVKAKRLAYFSNHVDKVARAYGDLGNVRKRERQYGGGGD
jgi:hypothetical protein